MNLSQPLVSVVILTFNSQKYIGRALASLRMQTYSNIEILVVDNGSVDDTRKIVEDFGGVLWLDLPQSDVGMARNHGIKQSHGEYLMFLDSDDFYLSNKVELQIIAMIKKPELMAVFSPAYIYRTGKEGLVGIKSNTQQLLGFMDFMNGNCYTLAALCVRRSALNSGLAFGEGEFGLYGEDWRFQLSLAHRRLPYDVLETPTVVVEIRERSASSSWEFEPKAKANALNFVSGLLKTNACSELPPKAAQKILDGHRFKLVISLIILGRNAEARLSRRYIYSPTKSFVTGALLGLSEILPGLVQSVLKFAYLVRQNRSFKWFRPPAHIETQIKILNN